MSNKSYLSVYAKSFSWAGFFLPKETFKKCSALYDFCRVADNIADDDGEIESKKKKFDQFVNDFNQKKFDDPIIKNMWSLIEEFNISLKVVQDLLTGIKSDIISDADDHPSVRASVEAHKKPTRHRRATHEQHSEEGSQQHSLFALAKRFAAIMTITTMIIIIMTIRIGK